MCGCSGGVRGCSGEGACVVALGGVHGCSGGVHGEGGVCVTKGVCMVKGGCVWRKGGACVVCTPPRDTAGHCADGTHPTGIHSCLLRIYGGSRIYQRQGVRGATMPAVVCILASLVDLLFKSVFATYYLANFPQIIGPWG